MSTNNKCPTKNKGGTFGGYTVNNKEKNIKVRIEDKGYNSLENIASKTESTKSAVLRNSIPEIVTSKEFDNLLNVHNLIYLEKKANECVDFFMKKNYLPVSQVAERFPAFVMDDTLHIKYPTYKVLFPPYVEEKEINKILKNLKLNESDYVKYEDMVFVFNTKEHDKKIAYFLLALKNNLEANKQLIQKIIKEFDLHGMKCTVYPAYYLKPFKLNLSENKKLIEGIAN